MYRHARASSAILSFNLATLLEDLEREDEAVTAYREALALDPLLGMRTSTCPDCTRRRIGHEKPCGIYCL
jgi:hypothetical protein